MPSRQTLLAGPALCLLPWLVGCGGGHDPTYPVQGTVRVDGKPINAGSVVFESVEPGSDGKRYSARGTLQNDGTFRLTTFTENDGAVAGRHRAMVMGSTIYPPEQALPSSARVVPKRYASLETSGLEFDVKAGPNRIDIELSSK